MKNTKIEWAKHTFNPWVGCTKVSPGCANCYAERNATRFRQAEWGVNGTRNRTSYEYWRQPYKWDRYAEKSGELVSVFCGSMCDVFEDREDVNEWREDLLHLISETTRLRWLLLTKRPENIDTKGFSFGRDVWLGTSIENQEQAETRLPWLANHARTHNLFVSCEPLLQPVFLHRWLHGGSLQWVIVGGESGPGARLMHPDWVRSIRDQCQEAHIPFFFKQWGAWAPWDGDCWECPSGWDDNELSDVARPVGGVDFVKVGKSAAGRELDGREWLEVPAHR